MGALLSQFGRLGPSIPTSQIGPDRPPMNKAAARGGLSVEELIRKITMQGLQERAKYPVLRDFIEEEEPGILGKVLTHNDDVDHEVQDN